MDELLDLMHLGIVPKLNVILDLDSTLLFSVYPPLQEHERKEISRQALVTDIHPFFKSEAGYNCKRHYSLVFRKNVH